KKAGGAPVAVLHLETFVVNLADPDHSSFLRLGVALGLSKPLPKGGESEKDAPYIPNIRDAILNVLGSWQSSALLAPDGKEKLKQQLLHVLQQRAPELGIVDIYFTDFLIQQ
ncbi:MAG TPA: flagellar basal body-associated FliL family protein, partial [Terriglobia bacterium]|nr:flagellar basal body-associated FliL family protein [Terriglobia bacterium]